VIAIISILAAILFPVFAQARAKARQASCSSNMKQIGTAVLMYAQDYDETTPPSALPVSGEYATVWCGSLVMGPYTKNVQIFHCPEDKSDIFDWSSGLVASRKKVGPLSYAINDLYPDAPAFGVQNPQGAFGFYTGSPQTSLATISAPADLVMLTDGHKQLDAFHAVDVRYVNTEVAYMVLSTAKGTWPVDYAWAFEWNIHAIAGEDPFKVWRRHSDGTNVAFMDGHVKWNQRKDLDKGNRWVANWPN
jgi:prepilin-type processing-associated H-X9-DG protein